MSISAVKRGVVAAAICLLSATALSSRAIAACCVCTGCQGESTLCSSIASCDFPDCASHCEAAGCVTDTIDDRACGAIPMCPLSASAGGPAMMLSLTLVLVTLAAFALRRRSLPIPIRVASLAAVIIASAAAINAITQIQVSGQWHSDTAAELPAAAPQQWNATLVVGRDGSLSGTVELTGFGDVDVANVEGTLVDGVTSGTLRAPDGVAIAQFQGNGDAHAVQGTFTNTQNGQTGTFSWSSKS